MRRACLRPALAPLAEPQQASETTASSPWPTGHRFAERTRAKYATVHALTAGHSMRSIARQLGMGFHTVLRFSRATAPEQLFSGQGQSRPTQLDAYKPCLDQRWQEGCTNAWKLWEEIKEHGYPDGYGNVRAYVSRNLRGKPQPIGPRPPSARAVTRWILTHPDALTESDRLQLKAVLAHCPELDALTERARPFAHAHPAAELRSRRRPRPPDQDAQASMLGRAGAEHRAGVDARWFALIAADQLCRPSPRASSSAGFHLPALSSYKAKVGPKDQ
ncbi:hypothetical protein ACIA6C_14480 [Streptomyces sp. NPDC051578]|uniref:hypothetical protein n=1 Tax=Streptomyces sp. NPDC051578 TaxID=3365662 RepID=UPI00379A6EEF